MHVRARAMGRLGAERTPGEWRRQYWSQLRMFFSNVLRDQLRAG